MRSDLSTPAPAAQHLRAAPAKCGRLALAAVALLAACAAPHTPSAIMAGQTADEVQQRMGPATARYAMPGGGMRLEYNRMPMGLQTYMVDLGADGRVIRWEQVLDENHFNRIELGVTADDVLRMLGPPTQKGRILRPVPAVTWQYRFDSPHPCILFELMVDANGKVIDKGYTPDLRCGPIRS